jgi:hypothetical protein
MKNSNYTTGNRSRTFRFVAQFINHCATACPRSFAVYTKYYSNSYSNMIAFGFKPASKYSSNKHKFKAHFKGLQNFNVEYFFNLYITVYHFLLCYLIICYSFGIFCQTQLLQFSGVFICISSYMFFYNFACCFVWV